MSASDTGTLSASVDCEIRPERPDDRDAIHELTRRAFAPMPYSDGDEQYLLDALRDASALSVSLVAEQAGAIVGHVAFSPAFPADGSPGWYALGPVSADPDLQKRGIGSRLIGTGLDRLRARGAAGCILVGDPAYYSRFGFRLRPDRAPEDQPKNYFQMLPLGDAEPAGSIDFHPVFRADHGREPASDRGE
ncbi:MAG: GNAT family N-acetyltransferase [Parasphingopyxis sp.]|uniref:GNAT family N-acetyltransferase n=1 Tax=Parasphingopyxis sp. TaxID=1920299 RepID=UPI003F9F6565